jgi:hypothetical protein
LEIPNRFPFLRDDLKILDFKRTGKRNVFYPRHNGLWVLCFCFTARAYPGLQKKLSAIWNLNISCAGERVPYSLEEYINDLASSGNQTTNFLGFPNQIPITKTSTHLGYQKGEIFDIKCIGTFIT